MKKSEFTTSNIHIRNNLTDITLIAEFHSLNGRYPTHGSENDTEKRLGIKLSKLRGAKKGLPYCAWFPQYSKLAQNLGYPDMFKPVDRKKKTLLIIKKIGEFYHKHGKYASQYSEDDEEKKLWAKRACLKQAKKGKGGWRWFPEYDTLAEKLGLPNMFEEVLRVETRLEVIKEIAEFYLKNKRLPRTCADPYEKKLRSQLNVIKITKNGKGTKNWDKSYDALVKKMGCPDLLKTVNYKTNNLSEIKKIASFFHKNGRYPSRYAKGADEKKLAERLHNFKKAKNNCGRYLWSPEYEKHAAMLGCPDMFKTGVV